MQYGPLSNSDASFRALCMLLAHDPMYATMPVSRLVEFRKIIERRHTFCALEGDVLMGMVAWHPISTQDALESIRARRWPEKDFLVGDSGGMLLGAFIAPSPREALSFFRRFVDANKGKLLIMQRHHAGRKTRYLWIDRSGKLLGGDL